MGAPIAQVGARRLPGGQRIEVSRFDEQHERLELGPHRHRDLELIYFQRGGGTHRLGRRTYGIVDGDVLLVTPGVVHDVPEVGSARGWVVEFHPLAAGLGGAGDPTTSPTSSLRRSWWADPRLAPFLHAERHPSASLFTVPPRQRALWAAHLRLMLREQSERRDGYLEMVGAYLQIVLVALARLAAEDAEGFGRTADPTVARAFSVIAHRFAEPLSTSDVARELGLTPGHLTTVVRRRTGRTVGEWVLEHRMAAARDLLVTTDLSAEQVAGRVGFADPGYFSRRFRQVHDLPPGTWRSAARR